MSGPRVSAAAVGQVGVVVTLVRGPSGPGEVRVVHDGLPHTYLAYAARAVPVGAHVLVLTTRGPRSLDVEPWDIPGPDAAGVLRTP